MVATIIILVQLAVLYLLLVFPWPVRFSFRLFLGLVITWPVMSLYLRLPMPAGIPDFHYQRGYALIVLIFVFMAMVAGRRRRWREKPGASALPAGLDSWYDDESSPRLRPAAGTGRNALETRAPADEVFDNRRLVDDSFRDERSPVPGRAADFDAIEANEKAFYGRELIALPLAVRAFVICKGVALVNGIASGVSDSTAIAGYLDATIIPVTSYYLAKRFVVSRRDLYWLMGSLIAVATIICMSGLYERVLDLQESAFPIAAYDDIGSTRFLDVPRGRAAGVVASPSVFGGIMGLGLLTSVGWMVHTRKYFLKMSLGSLAVLLGYGVFVSFTRSVWISVFVAFFLAQFCFKDLWRIAIPMIIAGGIALLLIWSTLQENEIMQDRVLDEQNVVGRVDRFIWSWTKFIERPIIGRGPEALNQLMRDHYYAEDGFDTSHNTYMSMLVDYGIFVFLSFCVTALGWLKKAWAAVHRFGRNRVEQSFIAAMAGFVVIQLLCGMSLELSYFTFYQALFWIAGAVIERLSDVSLALQEQSARGGELQ